MPAIMLDHDSCYRALLSRDARFDGRFFIAVTSTVLARFHKEDFRFGPF